MCKLLFPLLFLLLFVARLDSLSSYISIKRQFPRASGYPEDPATGIAAAALAMSLHSRHPRIGRRFKFYQGSAMGKPSLIVVDKISFEESTNSPPLEENEEIATGRLAGRTVSFEILGRVEIDNEETIHLDSIQ
jgi:predicted PhzF superfamily epimerase YddE/YHI9